MRDLTLEAFAQWLRARPADTSYSGRRSICCPIAQYRGLPSAPRMSGIPDWATRYMNEFDAGNSRSQGAALAALEVVEGYSL